MENREASPNDFRLEQNYPNPFNPTTAIGYHLPAMSVQPGQAGLSAFSHVTLKVFDVLGREVATLVDEAKHAGRYSVAFDATGLPSGIYFYRLTAGDFVETKRMMVLK